MILVLLGTINHPFDRILKELEYLKKGGLISEKIVAQIGHTKFESQFIETFDFKSSQDLDKLINQAVLVIAHAGTGSAISVLTHEKRLILAPRYIDFFEHTDNHQVDLALKFQELNYCMSYFKDDILYNKIQETMCNNFTPYKSNVCFSVVFLKDLIDKRLE